MPVHPEAQLWARHHNKLDYGTVIMEAIAYDQLIGTSEARKPSPEARKPSAPVYNTVHEDRSPSQQAATTLNKVRGGMTFVGAVLIGIALIFGLIVTVLDKTVLKH